MSEVELLTTANYSTHFPGRLDKEVPRDNYFDSFELNAKSCSAIVLEGNSISGKSVLLRQFCEKNFSRSISIFIDEQKSSSYDQKLALILKKWTIFIQSLK
ncbi:hypothetical protein IRM63_05125 [Leuconostoc citreum]|uniref:hypothetical protein n=1 Tax=Leuconostoc citreum TaxID=33964 RepID=UPI001888AB9A|nr:hypothetical protein [Leuconostoc citreum]MCT3054787.1 hypothetical protein [Leuconostoc citreum]MCT3063264.1 hypothetical protein [Leuconostoc citreum]MCT3073176.1 hypothetical protein [Leuconostoc citreum]QOY96894.1 hypothetical protein IRM63_05125 [Leuconostoc citreum]